MADDDNPTMSTINHEAEHHGSSLTADQHPSTRAPPHPQYDSVFFKKLPQEIRDMIYKQVFAFTRLSYGKQIFCYCSAEDPSSIKVIRPAPHALALLRVCRRITEEIGNRWLRQVLFSFDEPCTMVDKLATLPVTLVSEIRHARVRNLRALVLEDMRPCTHDPCSCFGYTLTYFLKRLPGLKLDTLTVLGYVPRASFDCSALSKLIACSDGWKELRFIACNSEMLHSSWNCDDQKKEYVCIPQPAHWQKVLEERDGVDSCPSVELYRSKRAAVNSKPSTGSLMLNPANWEPFTMEEVEPGQAFRKTQMGAIMCNDAERCKELLVIAKRGKATDYQVKRDSPSIKYDTEEEAPGTNWKKLWQYFPPRVPLAEVIEDSEYASVDEYEWHYLDDSECECAEYWYYLVPGWR